MADVNALSGLYPQPPAANRSPLNGDPGQVVGLMNALNQNKLFNAQFPALAQQPQTALEGAQIHNDTAALEQRAKQQGFLVDSLGALADDPKLNADKVRNTAVTWARNLKLPGEMVNSWLYDLPKDPVKLRERLVQMRNLAIGASGLSTPTDIGITPQNAPVTGTRGQFNYGSAGGDIGGNPGNRTPGVVTKPAPGVAEAQVQTGAGSGAALNEARQGALNYQQHVFPLEQAIPALERLGATGTGPGTDELNKVKSFLQSAGIPGLSVDKIKDFDEAKKYLTDFVNQNGNSGTNDKLAAAFAGNPSVHISNAAALDVAKSALSLRRMKQAQLVEFEKSGRPDSDYTKWASQWNLSHDPRVYGFDMMAPEQRKKVLSEMPENKQQLFMMAVQDAVTHGIIRTPQAAK